MRLSTIGKWLKMCWGRRGEGSDVDNPASVQKYKGFFSVCLLKSCTVFLFLDEYIIL